MSSGPTGFAAWQEIDFLPGFLPEFCRSGPNMRSSLALTVVEAS
jgi:hypothetical protein